MSGTADWYCSRCSRFIAPCLVRCTTCGRIRGSARRDESSPYWVRVFASPQGEASAAAPPFGLVSP